MKVRVDKETCVGDETCVEICPEIFEMNGDVAVTKMEEVPKELERKVQRGGRNLSCGSHPHRRVDYTPRTVEKMIQRDQIGKRSF